MRRISGLVTLAVFATATWVQAQSPSSPNERIPTQRPIAGTVVDDQGQPIPGARLWWGGRNGFVELTADQGGRFKATSPLAWKLLEGPTALGTIWAEAEGFALKSTTILGGDEQTRPELELKVKLHKHSPASPSRVRVVDPNGTPVAQARVEVSKIYSGNPAPFSRFSGQTDGKGLFEFDRMPPDGPPLRITTADGGVQDFRLMSITGAPETRVLQLRPTGRLEGRIVGPAESRRGLQITVYSEEPPNSQELSQERLKAGVRPEFTIVTLEPDSEGRFTVPAFIAGKVRVEVQPPPDTSYVPEVPRELELAAGSTTTVEVPMTRGIPVTGRIIDGLTSAPLPGVLVSLGRIETSTDREGRFKTVALPGRVRAQIRSGGSEEAGLYLVPPPVALPTIDIKPDDKEKEYPEIRLTAARRIIGRLVSKSHPVHQMQVAADNLPQRGRCDAEGYFLLVLPLDLKPKKYQFGDWLGGTMPEARVISTSPLVLEMPEFFTF